jgi:hypothetical protein
MVSTSDVDLFAVISDFEAFGFRSFLWEWYPYFLELWMNVGKEEKPLEKYFYLPTNMF